jgi:uncharacterized membrane protein
MSENPKDMSTPEIEKRAERARDPEVLRNVAALGYGLQALGLLLLVLLPALFVAAVVVAYVKRDDANGSWVASHFRWQIRSFWFGLLWASLGTLTSFIFVGYFILIAAWVWLVYRVVKGALYLYDRRPIEVAA